MSRTRFSLTEAANFAVQCRELRISPPPALIRGLEQAAVIQRIQSEPTPPLLSLTEAQLRQRVRDEAMSRMASASSLEGHGLVGGVSRVLEELSAEVRAAAMPELEPICDELRTRFQKRAKPIEIAAQEFGFTFATSSDDVIMLDNKAISAWKAIPGAWNAIQPLVDLRIEMSSVFEASPNERQMRDLRWSSGRHERRPPADVNYSVAFAGGDNWGTGSDYYLDDDAAGQLNWLELARGGLRINSPEEVARKIESRRIQSRLPARVEE
jgi:hypothetical protein